VFETQTMIAGKKLVQSTAEFSAEREGHRDVFAGSRFSIDQLDFTRFLKGVCLRCRSCDAKNCIHSNFTLNFSFVNFLGEYVLITNEAGDSYVLSWTRQLLSNPRTVVLGHSQPSLRDCSRLSCLPRTNVLGYSQPSLRDLLRKWSSHARA
jgi:hypothetical protein